MILTLNITPTEVRIGKQVIREEEVPVVAQFCQVIDKSHPDKLVVNLWATLETPGAWRLPWDVLKLLY